MRLTWDRLYLTRQQTLGHDKIKSYEKTVGRLLESIKKFHNSEDKLKMYLGNICIDSLISLRIDNEKFAELSDINSKILFDLSKKVLKNNGDDIKDLIDCNGIDSNINRGFKRQASNMYLMLGAIIYDISNSGESCRGLELLATSLMIRALSLNLRMQVLELTWLMSDKEKNLIANRELPYSLFNLDKDCTSIAIGMNIEDANIVEELFKINSNKYINLITPVGWILLLAHVLELDSGIYETELKRQQFRNDSEKFHNDNKSTIISFQKLIEYFSVSPPEEKKSGVMVSECVFPFDGFKGFIDNTSKDIISIYVDDLNIIDEINNLEIKYKESEFYAIRNVSINTISLNLAGEGFSNRPKKFVTDAAFLGSFSFSVDLHFT